MGLVAEYGASGPQLLGASTDKIDPEYFGSLGREDQIKLLKQHYPDIYKAALSKGKYGFGMMASDPSKFGIDPARYAEFAQFDVKDSKFQDFAENAATIGMIAGSAYALGPGSAASNTGAAAGGLNGTGAYGMGGSLFGTGANMSTVGLGSQGMLAASGGIAGGAGTGILGSLGGGSGLLSANSIQNAARLSGLLGSGSSGSSGGGGGVASMPLLGGGGGQPQSPQAAPIQQQRLPTTQQAPLQSFGRKPYQFKGATVWM